MASVATLLKELTGNAPIEKTMLSPGSVFAKFNTTAWIEMELSNALEQLVSNGRKEKRK